MRVIESRPAEVRPPSGAAVRAAVVALVVAATAVAFSPVLSSQKEFTNWDDPVYVTEQPLVQQLSGATLWQIFDVRTAVLASYHPLTVLSLALDYRVSGLAVWAYALTNYLLHVLVTVLVFVFLRRLTGRLAVAGLAALWFGIHPMHVESVAWISGRKDLVYGGFFFLACIAYLAWLSTGRAVHLALTFAAFVCSCLGKGMAVPLPLVLLLLDLFHGRRVGARMFLEKIPFVAVSVAVAWVGVRLQAAGLIADFETYTPLQRAALAAYGFVMYWAKLFVPVRLSAFYPPPDLGDARVLPLEYWLMPPLALLIVVGPLAVAWRQGRDAFRVAWFGIGFFVATIVLVLQFVSFGQTLMADRFTYVSYAGPLLLVASAVDALLRRPRLRGVVAVGVALWTVWLGVATWRRAWVWTNSETLWNDVIEQYPFRLEETPGGTRVRQRGVVIAYQNRGNYYREHGRLDLAVKDYEVLVAARVSESAPYVNMANVRTQRGATLLGEGRRAEAEVEFDQAIRLYGMALERGTYPFETYLSRAVAWESMGRHEEALADFRAAFRLNPSAPRLLASVAYEELQLGRYEDCLASAGRAIAAEPNDPNGHQIRGLAYMKLGRVPEAISDLQRAVALAPGLGASWAALSELYARTGNAPAAEEAARRARAAGGPPR